MKSCIMTKDVKHHGVESERERARERESERVSE